MIKLLDLSYHTAPPAKSAEQLLNTYHPATGFADFLPDQVQIRFIKHACREESISRNGIAYDFLKSSNSFWHIPFRTQQVIKEWQPDVVMVQGLIFPLQLIFLRRSLGNKCKILVQHHGEKPFTGLKKLIQKYAFSAVDAFVFTAAANADPWKKAGLIRKGKKIYELLEASTMFCREEKALSCQETGLAGSFNFLWVGRLNANKGPLTVLRAFEKYLSLNPEAKLYMIYQTDELLREIKKMLIPGTRLKKAVVLKGWVANSELPYWYSAADFFISASHQEGSGYALIEAMACGCIPVVSDIPSFRKLTGDGEYSLLFPPSDYERLLQILHALDVIDRESFSSSVAMHFKEELSFRKIAEKLHDICLDLIQK